MSQYTDLRWLKAQARGLRHDATIIERQVKEMRYTADVIEKVVKRIKARDKANRKLKRRKNNG